MATIFADPVTGPTIQAAVNSAASGDIVSCKPGTYNESVSITANKDVTITSRDGLGTAIMDGQKSRNTAINYQARNKLTVTNMEIMNYRAFGVQFNNPNTTGQTGTPGYQPLLLMNPASSYLIQGNHIHHIGASDSATPGFPTAQWGIWCNAGYQGQILSNLVHNVGDTNESIGIVCYYGYQPTIRFNETYMCRKEGIRYGYGLEATVDSNLTYQSWVGITSEFEIGARISNNVAYDCDWGAYIKQSNNNTQANPPTRTFWGDALALGAPAPAQIVGYWNNTAAGCRFNCVSLATQYAQDSVDIRNNMFVGLTYTNAAGVDISPGDAFIQDAGSAALLTNVTVDYNTYVTAYGQPAFFVTKGQNTPGGTNSAVGLAGTRAWRGAGWEVHGQVADPVFTDVTAKDFSHSVNFTGFNLTTSPLNNVGSPYGTQVGANVATVPTATATTTYRLGSIDSSSGHAGAAVEARTVDLRYLLYWQSPTGGTTGVGINQFIVYDFGSPQTFNHFVTGDTLVDNSQLKKVKWESSNDKVTWTNLATTPGFENWPTSTTTIQVADSGQTSHVMELNSTVTARYVRCTVVDTFGKNDVTSSLYLPVFVTPNVVAPPSPPPPTVTPGLRIGNLRGLGTAAR